MIGNQGALRGSIVWSISMEPLDFGYKYIHVFIIVFI